MHKILSLCFSENELKYRGSLIKENIENFIYQI